MSCRVYSLLIPAFQKSRIRRARDKVNADVVYNRQLSKEYIGLRGKVFISTDTTVGAEEKKTFSLLFVVSRCTTLQLGFLGKKYSEHSWPQSWLTELLYEHICFSHESVEVGSDSQIVRDIYVCGQNCLTVREC